LFLQGAQQVAVPVFGKHLLGTRIG
jgi:hypothetical protein